MAINYDPPNDLTTDVFTTPSTPQSTPLSQAGSSNRNHPQMHHDIGLAVEALEQWASISTHDHSGDTASPSSGPQLVQANTHQNPDTDATATALHHTIGSFLPQTPVPPGLNPNPALQAASGSHTHLYNTLLQTPLQICTSTSRPSNPPAGMQIYETDTNCARVWAAFANNVINQGLYSADYFNTQNGSNLGSGWTQTYALPPSSGNGFMATPDGQTVSWTTGTTYGASNWCIALRTSPVDGQTLTDDQLITYQTGQDLIQYELLSGYASNDVYMRVSADLMSYVRIAVSVNFVTIYYTTQGPGNEKQLAQFGWPLEPNPQSDVAGSQGQTSNAVTGLWSWLVDVADDVVNDVESLVGIAPTAGNPSAASQSSAMQTIGAGATLTFSATARTFTVAVNGAVVATLIDGAAATRMGSGNRGWGIGMHAPAAILGSQLAPANLKYVSVSDQITYGSVNRWSLLSSASVPNVILRQTQTKQSFAPVGTTVSWDTVDVDNFGYYNPSSPGQLLISESGLYQVSASVAWDPLILPAYGGVAICRLGNQPTDRVMVSQQWLQWNMNSPPGFSQNITVTGKLRLAMNDIIYVEAFFPNSVSGIYSFFNLDNGIYSRFELVYLSP